MKTEPLHLPPPGAVDAMRRELEIFGVASNHDHVMRVFIAALYNAGFKITRERPEGDS